MTWHVNKAVKQVELQKLLQKLDDDGHTVQFITFAGGYFHVVSTTA